MQRYRKCTVTPSAIRYRECTATEGADGTVSELVYRVHIAIWLYNAAGSTYYSREYIPRGVGPSTTLAWPGWKQPDIPVEVDTGRLETRRREAGVLKKLSLAGLAKLSRLRYSWLRSGLASADYPGLRAHNRLVQGWAKLVLIALERYSVALKRLTFNLR